MLFEIPSATRIVGSSAVGGLFAKLLAGWQPPDGLPVVRWPLDRFFKADGAIGGFSAVGGSPETAPSIGRSG